MDRILDTSNKKLTRTKLICILVMIGCMVLAYRFLSADSDKKQQYIAKSSVSISTIKEGFFADTLNVRGTLMPKKTFYLDAIVGGTVVEKFVERGAYVKKGDPLLRLSNTALQLDVISRQAQITQQLNFLRNNQMNAEATSLNLEREILDTNNQIRTLERKLKKFRTLRAKDFVDAETVQELEQSLEYLKQRREINSKQIIQQKKTYTLQVTQLEENAAQLPTNLELALKSIDDLLVRAPESGYLSELDIELGESKPAGTRLGQIDAVESLKVVASVDEFYLTLLSVGMPVSMEADGLTGDSKIVKVDSRVQLGQFTIEIDIPHSWPEKSRQTLKRGQSIELVLTLGKSIDNSLLLTKGAFYMSTGGNWAFVVDENGTTARRKNIKIGKQNRQYYQVLEGLNNGDRVITSSYNMFDNADKIILN